MPDKNGYFRFEKLTVWSDARQFVSFVYKTTENFPARENFGLTNQIRRSAVSIALNIAEGSTKGSDADFKRFLKMAQGSVNETVTGFYISLDQHFVSKKEFELVYESALSINTKLNALIKSLSH